MSGNPSNIDIIELAWELYTEGKSVQDIVQGCAKAGHLVHRNTVSRWIQKGVAREGIIPFKTRLMKIRAATAKLAEEPKERPATQIEVTSSLSLDDIEAAEIGAARLAEWRYEADMMLFHSRAARDKVLDCLMGVDPENPAAIRDATTALKNVVQAMKGITEIHTALKALGAGGDDDGPMSDDEAARKFFEGWTREEREAFRERGVWPESQGPAPKYITTTADNES